MQIPPFLSPADKAKWAASSAALAHVKSGMTIGLGTGSTADIFIQLLAEYAGEKSLELVCVATSQRSSQLAKSLGLNVVEFTQVERIHVCVDGADQVDSKKRLIKGHGGASTREKIVEYASDKLVIIADESKKAAVLNKPVPVEFLPFARMQIEKRLKKLGAKKIELMLNSHDLPFVTDNGLWMLMVNFGAVKNPAKLESEINDIEGVLENGIFGRAADVVIFGLVNGKTKTMGK